ncbi:MAG: GAP family protein [Candidatus Micrarchaeota archaeon]
MAVEANIPTIMTVLITAAIDSINPCAIGVLILLISTVIATNLKRDRMLVLGFAYISAVYITYLIAGLGLIAFFTTIPQSVAEYISIFVGAIVVFAGLVEIKDFYWYGQGFSLAIPPEMAKRIHGYAQNLTVPGMVFLGAFVSAVELPCTGAPYLAIITVLRQGFNIEAFLLMLLYNFVFVLPLIIILFLAYFGMKITDLKMWKEQNRGYMRLFTGLLLIALGWMLIFIANGTINFG